MANTTLYTVKRIRDGRQIDIRLHDDGEIQLRWARRPEDATRMTRPAAQCVAAVMTVDDTNDDVIIEEAQ